MWLIVFMRYNGGVWSLIIFVVFISCCYSGFYTDCRKPEEEEEEQLDKEDDDKEVYSNGTYPEIIVS